MVITKLKLYKCINEDYWINILNIKDMAHVVQIMYTGWPPIKRNSRFFRTLL